MLIIASSMRVEKARRDFYQLKEQYSKKRIKYEIALREQMEKASAEYVELMFLYERYVWGDYYKIAA